ncbi:MAG: hypothetical protein JXB23_09840, partial [Candidatus Aminicenantes bacterium]|nr:hypothetical protein [Candidatus Aminicenantes bacterium]
PVPTAATVFESKREFRSLVKKIVPAFNIFPLNLTCEDIAIYLLGREKNKRDASTLSQPSQQKRKRSVAGLLAIGILLFGTVVSPFCYGQETEVQNKLSRSFFSGSEGILEMLPVLG